MSTIPTPRSRSQILGSMLNSFLSRLGLPGIKTGDPSLSILEAAAQSDFRNVQEIFNLLNATNIDTATGPALDRIGAAEQVRRITESSSTGFVSISDSSFTKIETRVYQGGAGITAGSTSLRVESAIPANGQLYIGRGSDNQEGPIAYTTVVASGNYYIITLSSPTTNYHQIGELVTYAQGGDRFIPAGTVVGTPATSATGQVQFRTLTDATIYDGETTVTGVSVQCTTSGLSGNVSAGAINSFVSAPFTGATVTNPLPITNATALEANAAYKERIRLARKSRAKAIRDAVVSGLIGARSSDEAGQIVSVSTSFRAGEPRTIYIDDGTGYQEKDEGVVRETIIDSAVGGEQYFQLSNRPVAKAYLKTRSTAPFVVIPDSALSIDVGGVRSTHTFGETSFADLSNASAYEIAASVNANPALLFSARVCDSGTAVAFFAKSEGNEDLLVRAQTDVLFDANSWLNLPTAHTRTLYLYKNEALLTEDGAIASVQTKQFGLWTALSSGATLDLEVDGIPSSIVVTDTDFVNAGTPYITVSHTNSLASWAAVLNYKIAGITARVSGNSLVLTSNLGRNNRSSVKIVDGSIASSMFELPAESRGASSDYILDRNSGQIKLTTPLTEGDSLVAGATRTNAYLRSEPVGTLVLGSTAELWFLVDGNQAIRATGLGVGSPLTWGVSGPRAYIESPTPFLGVEEGDWLMVSDPAVDVTDRGLYRISEVATGPHRIYFHKSGVVTGTILLSEGGLSIARCDNEPVKIEISSGSYSATTLASALAFGGSRISVADDTVIVSTNLSTGQLSLVLANFAGQQLGFPYRTVRDSGITHSGTVVTGNGQLGIPDMQATSVVGVVDTSTFTPGPANVERNILAQFKMPASLSPTVLNQHNKDIVRSIAEWDTSDVTLRQQIPVEFLVDDSVVLYPGFAITPNDTLQWTVDGDSTSGRFSAPMYRRCQVVSAAGTTWTLREEDGTSLLSTFGSGFDWTDFSVQFKARAKTHSATKSVLWRWWQHGQSGVDARIQYQYGTQASVPASVEASFVQTSSAEVVVRLATGAARSGVPTAGKVGVAITQLTSNLYTYVGAVNLAVSNAVREVRLNYNSKSLVGAWTGGSITQPATGATATVVADSTHMLQGYLVLTAVTGTFVANQPIQLDPGPTPTINPTTGIYGYTTLTVALPATVTNHGIPVGETIYVSTSGSGFVPGSRTVQAVAPTTVSYVDDTATATSLASNGTVSVNRTGPNVLGGSVVTGDIVSLVECPALPQVFRKATKATVTGSGSGWSSQHYQGQTPSTTLAWYPLAGLQFYPLHATNNRADLLVAAVNQQVDSPVTGVAPAGTGAGTIDAASYESAELGGANPWWSFVDGYNWVSSHSPSGGNVEFTLRDSVSSTMFDVDVGSEVVNEDVRLVPTTGPTVARFLNSLAVSGLANRGSAFALADGRVGMDSSLAGSDSSIRVTGGTANVDSVLVAGSAESLGSGEWFVQVQKSDGVSGGQAVWIQNSLPHTKPVFLPTTQIQSTAVTGVVTLVAERAWTKAVATNTNAAFDIERRGQLVALTNTTDFAAANVGDYIWLRPESPAVSNVLLDINAGIFRVVAVDSGTVYIDHNNAVEQQVVGAVADIIEANSIVPGDTVTFGDSSVGVANVGTRRVVSIGPGEFEFTLDTSTKSMSDEWLTLTLGSNYTKFTVTSGTPARFVSRIVNTIPVDSEHCKLSFDQLPSGVVSLISESFATSVAVANKLQFPGAPHNGVDSYKANTGLIAEANRIVFGDETNANEYPGIASAGASYNISGPLVKTVRVALSIRPATGVFLTSIREQVASAVASTINRSPIGKAIAISAIVSAAQSVNGVVAVAVMSPSYNSGDDLIPVQPYEKPMVLNLDSDISITFVGE